MIVNWIRFALSQRLMICLAVLLLCGGGYIAFKKIPIDAFPEV
jgi:cobalt-zinc-cadmium resistance protein CzcA